MSGQCAAPWWRRTADVTHPVPPFDLARNVQDDTFDVDEGTSEDEVERKIAEEHVKYKEAQAKRQEEVSPHR